MAMFLLALYSTIAHTRPNCIVHAAPFHVAVYTAAAAAAVASDVSMQYAVASFAAAAAAAASGLSVDFRDSHAHRVDYYIGTISVHFTDKFINKNISRIYVHYF